jgi:hypothetical protein
VRTLPILAAILLAAPAAAQEASSLSGRVVGGPGGEPVPFAAVSVSPAGLEAVADEAGRFAFDALPAGPVDVVVAAADPARFAGARRGAGDRSEPAPGPPAGERDAGPRRSALAGDRAPPPDGRPGAGARTAQPLGPRSRAAAGQPGRSPAGAAGPPGDGRRRRQPGGDAGAGRAAGGDDPGDRRDPGRGAAAHGRRGLRVPAGPPRLRGPLRRQPPGVAARRPLRRAWTARSI